VSLRAIPQVSADETEFRKHEEEEEESSAEEDEGGDAQRVVPAGPIS
jgi:hypothetical protein